MDPNQNSFGNNLSDDDAAMPIGVVQEAPLADNKKPSDIFGGGKYKKRVWLMLEDSDQIPPTGQFFGHDGVGFVLRPGEAAYVPIEILDILNNAVMSVPVVDQLTKQVTGYRNRLRFAYRIVPAPVQETRAA